MPTQTGTPVGYRADRTTQQLTPLIVPSVNLAVVSCAADRL
jgi:hypothetical protein